MGYALAAHRSRDRAHAPRARRCHLSDALAFLLALKQIILIRSVPETTKVTRLGSSNHGTPPRRDRDGHCGGTRVYPRAVWDPCLSL